LSDKHQIHLGENCLTKNVKQNKAVKLPQIQTEKNGLFLDKHRSYKNKHSILGLATNAHLRGKIELAKIGERSEQNSQLYFVPL
jgi:hypothetical protein